MENSGSFRKLITATGVDGACLAYVALASGQWIITKNGQELAKGDDSQIERALSLLRYLGAGLKGLAN